MWTSSDLVPAGSLGARGRFLAGASTRTMHGLVGALTGGVAAGAAVLGYPTERLRGPPAHQVPPAELLPAASGVSVRRGEGPCGGTR